MQTSNWAIVKATKESFKITSIYNMLLISAFNVNEQ